MKILITGATGFIGGRIADSLLHEGGHEVHFSGRSQPKDRALIEGGGRFAQGDLENADFCRELAYGLDAVIHCAGLAGTWGSDDAFQRANVTATQNLISAAREGGVGRFVNLSSPSIYFEFRDQLNLVESDLPKIFSNAYARTKWEAEQLVGRAHNDRFFTVSLRPRSVIGAGDQNVLPRLLRLQRSRNLVQVGKGENVVDITTVGNLIDAIRLCLRAPATAMGEVYNISNGAPIKFWEFVNMVLQKAGLPIGRKKIPYAPVMALAKLNEWVNRRMGRQSEPALLPISVGIIAFSMTMNIEKARQKLGYVPRLSTEDGVDEFLRWYKPN